MVYLVGEVDTIKMSMAYAVKVTLITLGFSVQDSGWLENIVGGSFQQGFG
jgi:hypothetical protein